MKSGPAPDHDAAVTAASNESDSDYTLDSMLTSELRFFIMAILAMYREVVFSFLKKELEASDGNLSVGLTKLEEAGYLVSCKEFVAKRPRTSYSITPLGLENLEKHIKKIESVKKRIIQSGKGNT